MARPFPTEAIAGDLAQIRHEQLKERGLCLRISGAPLLQQLRDFARAAWHYALPRMTARL